MNASELNEQGCLNRLRHNFMVQRDSKFKSLLDVNGDFIYKESDRPGNKPLTKQEETEANKAVMYLLYLVALIIIVVFSSFASPFLASLILVVGLSFLSYKLGMFAFVICVLWALF